MVRRCARPGTRTTASDYRGFQAHLYTFKGQKLRHGCVGCRHRGRRVRDRGRKQFVGRACGQPMRPALPAHPHTSTGV